MHITSKTTRFLFRKPALRIAAGPAAPMRVLAGWKPAVHIAALLVASSAAAVPFRQLSNPTGIVADQTVEVSPGDTVSTVYAPYTSGSWRFAFWEVNEVRQLSAAGHAINQAIFVAGSTNIHAEAFYVDQAADSDSDGMRDAYEYYTFGSLSREPADDSDGDGIDNLTEYQMSFSGREFDHFPTGGVASADSSLITFIDQSTGAYPYEMKSDPFGLLHQSGVAAPGVPITTPYLEGVNNSFYFIGWSINGVRQTSPEGLYLNQVSHILTNATEFMAHYVHQSTDSDDDGLLDRYEWQQFGGLHYSGTNNLDGDAHDIAYEYANSLSPLFADTLPGGGVSSADSAKLTYAALSKARYRVSSMPIGLLAETIDFVDVGTPWSSSYINEGLHSGYRFAYWTVDGVRQSGADSIALQEISITINADTEIVAHYLLPTVNSDGDGIADWKEWFYFGTLAHDETDDLDADGFSVAQEMSQSLGWLAKDTLPVGGISSADSPLTHFESGGIRKHYLVKSQPLGLLSAEGYLATGSAYVSTYVENSISGMYFAYWTLNGVRQTDAAGYALHQVHCTLDQDIELVAVFLESGRDEDGDGISDYEELRYFGTLAYDRESDPDGDGLLFGRELDYGLAPQLTDEVAVGGVSSADSALVSIIFIREIHAWGLDDREQTSIPDAVRESRILGAACGAHHSLVATTDGRVYSWGDDSALQISYTPNLDDAVAVAAGYAHSLVLRRDGRVLGWGANGSGQSSVPVDLAAVVEISAGESHSVALLANGHVSAWGGNGFGQCNVPAGLEKVIHIAAGGRHTLALHADGIVTAWGDNSEGQSTVPAGLANVVEIAAGDAHSLALKADGSVVAWGRNVEGQCTIPPEIVGQHVLKIAAGHYHNMALLEDGSIVAWGLDDAGQAQVPEWIDDVTALAAGRAHSLVLRLAAEPSYVATVPENMVFELGADLMLRTYGNAAQPQSFQWYRDGELLSGANTPFIFIEGVGDNDVGSYYCVVGNSLGSIGSAPIEVTLLPYGYFTWLKLYFNDAEIQDPLVYEYASDPDADGWPNLVEYLLSGFAPDADSVLSGFKPSAGYPGYVEFSYDTSSQAEGASLEVLYSESLTPADWQVLSADGDRFFIGQQGDTTTIYIRGDLEPLFIRFRAIVE